MGDGNLDCRGFVDLHHAFHTVDHQKLTEYASLWDLWSFK